MVKEWLKFTMKMIYKGSEMLNIYNKEMNFGLIMNKLYSEGLNEKYKNGISNGINVQWLSHPALLMD